MLTANRTTTGPVAILIGIFLLASCGGEKEEAVSDPGQGPAGDRAVVSHDELPLELQEELNLVVAKANGIEITARQVLEQAAIQRRKLEARGQALDDQQESRLLLTGLDRVIDGVLMLEAARGEGIKVDPAQLEGHLQALRDQFGTAEAFSRELAARGQTEEDVRTDLERTMIIQQYIAKVSGGAVVSEAEVRKYYDENPDLFRDGEKVRVSQILIRLAPDDPEDKRENARKRIDEVKGRLDEGADFAEMAKEYSQTTNSVKGGDVGFFPRGVMVKPFEEMSFGLKPGETSPVFETQYGYNIIRVTDRKEPSILPFEEIKPTLTLQLTQQREGKLMAEKLVALKDAARIEVLDTKMFPGGTVKEAGAKPAGAER